MNMHLPWSLLLWIVAFSAAVTAVTVYAYRSMKVERAAKKEIDDTLPQLAAMAQRRFEKVHGRKSHSIKNCFPELEKPPLIVAHVKKG